MAQSTKKAASPRSRRGVAGGRAAASHDAIARRAYELYEARGCAHGCDLDDWLQAERECGPASGAEPPPRRTAAGRSSAATRPRVR